MRSNKYIQTSSDMALHLTKTDKDKYKDKDIPKDKDKDNVHLRLNMCYIFEKQRVQGYQI